MTNISNLEAARLLIATLTDADKLALLCDQLDGDLGLDCQDACDLLYETLLAFDKSYPLIEEAIDAFEADDGYDGGRYDFETSRGLSA